jgi:hypothetical protein
MDGRTRGSALFIYISGVLGHTYKRVGLIAFWPASIAIDFGFGVRKISRFGGG